MRIAPAFRLVLFNSRLGNFQAQRRPAGHLGDNGGFLSKPPLGNHLIWLYANSIVEILRWYAIPIENGSKQEFYFPLCTQYLVSSGWSTNKRCRNQLTCWV